MKLFNIKKIKYFRLFLILTVIAHLSIISAHLNENKTYQALDFNDNDNKVTIAADLVNYEMHPGTGYSWIDISSTGTEIALSDDGYSTQALPFSFPFYDSSFSTIYVSANGYLSFYDSSPSYTGGSIPSGTSSHRYLIAPFWDDLYTVYAGGAGTVYVQSFGSYWIVQWDNIEHINGPLVGSFQVVLIDGGDIVFNYDYISYTAGGYTCGLNYGYDTNYYNRYYGITATTDDFAIQFQIDRTGGGVAGSATDEASKYLMNIGVISIIIIGTLAVSLFVLKRSNFAKGRMSD